MSTTKDDIARWWSEGLRQKATHMIVVCDTFDYEDYPVFVKPGENVQEKVTHYQNESSCSRVMEVYSYALPFSEQLNTHRAWNLT